MKIKVFFVNAFSTESFGGNLAVVCPLDEWLPDEILLKMTKQHNQSETAFFVEENGSFELRWFTVLGEIDMCGHATMATAHVLFHHLEYPDDQIEFRTRFVGKISVKRNDDLLTLNLPRWETEVTSPPELLKNALGIDSFKEVREARDYIVVMNSHQEVEDMKPDIAAMIPLGKSVCVTAAGSNDYDFVSRFFCPGESIPEDPVTGSTHSMLIPYWSNVLGKKKMIAKQVSYRSGELICELDEQRVNVSGKANTYLIGELDIYL